MKLHILTGGSKGLGRALAEELSERGDYVAILARGEGPQMDRVESFRVDLLNEREFEPCLERVFQRCPVRQFDTINLINNAGVVDPIARTETLSGADIHAGILVNLTAPIALTSSFLHLTRSLDVRRVIVNVSSGVAKNPMVGWAVYSAAKAGLENFSSGLIKEYASDEKTRIVNFNPGVIDTDLQTRIRASEVQDFADVGRFIDLKTQGQLKAPKDVALALSQVVNEEVLNEKDFISVSELI